jgi:hypothetical protein
VSIAEASGSCCLWLVPAPAVELRLHFRKQSRPHAVHRCGIEPVDEIPDRRRLTEHLIGVRADARKKLLDTTIANVALRYIAGGLSAAQTDADWVITSYLAANAIVLPITGWLSAHLGRRNYFLLSIAVFTLCQRQGGPHVRPARPRDSWPGSFTGRTEPGYSWEGRLFAVLGCRYAKARPMASCISEHV